MKNLFTRQAEIGNKFLYREAPGANYEPITSKQIKEVEAMPQGGYPLKNKEDAIKDLKEIAKEKGVNSSEFFSTITQLRSTLMDNGMTMEEADAKCNEVKKELEEAEKQESRSSSRLELEGLVDQVLSSNELKDLEKVVAKVPAEKVVEPTQNEVSLASANEDPLQFLADLDTSIAEQFGNGAFTSFNAEQYA